MNTCKHYYRSRCGNADCPAMEHACPVLAYGQSMCRYYGALPKERDAEFTEVVTAEITHIRRTYGDPDAFERALKEKSPAGWLRTMLCADDVEVLQHQIFRREE